MLFLNRNRRRRKNAFRTNSAVISTESLESRQLLSAARPQMTGPNGANADATPTITWDRVPGAERLELWVNHSDADGTEKVIHQKNLLGGTTSFGVNPELSPGQYQAWLKAYDGQNRSDGWSQPVSFQIGGGAAERGVITGTTTRNGTTGISWNSIAGADHVEVWINRVANDRSGDSRVIHQQNLAGTATEFSTGQLPAGTYKAWVKGHNQNFGSRGWSNAYSFIIVNTNTSTVPSVPQLNGQGGETNSSQPNFAWSRLQNATHTLLRIDRYNADGSVDHKVVRQWLNSERTDFELLDSQKLGQGNYWAWVIGYNANSGEFGEKWSNGINFQVRSQASAPVITSPGASVLSTTHPEIRWEGVDGAVAYRVEFDHDAGRFGDWGEVQNIVDQRVGRNTRYRPDVGLPNGNYTVKVHAIFADGSESTSGDRKFIINVSTEMGPGVRVMERRESWTPFNARPARVDEYRISSLNEKETQNNYRVTDTFGFTNRTSIKAVEWWGLYPDAELRNVANHNRGSFRVNFKSNLSTAYDKFHSFYSVNPRIAGFTWITENGVTQRVPVYQFKVQLQGIGLTTAHNTQYDLSILEYRLRGASPFNWMPSFAHAANSGENGWTTQSWLTQANASEDFRGDRAFTLFD